MASSDVKPMPGKCLVISGNRGLGLEIVRHLKKRQTDVIATCRSSNDDLEVFTTWQQSRLLLRSLHEDLREDLIYREGSPVQVLIRRHLAMLFGIVDEASIAFLVCATAFQRIESGVRSKLDHELNRSTESHSLLALYKGSDGVW